MDNAYKIGQKVFSSNNNYTINLDSADYEAGLFINGVHSIAFFKDFYISLKNSKFNPNKNYYLSLAIEKDNEYNRILNLKLIQKEEEKNKISYKKERLVEKDFFIPKGQVGYLNVIFNAIENDIYDTLVLEMERDDSDLQLIIDTNFGREIKVVDEKITLQEIINQNEEDKIIITEFGLQGEPGQLFTLDGEEIRIGKSGVYEMHYDNVAIKNFGIIPQGNILILDYKYKEAEE